MCFDGMEDRDRATINFTGFGDGDSGHSFACSGDYAADESEIDESMIEDRPVFV